MRIKCPCCGSAAQIELAWQDYSNYSTENVKEYFCTGCRCTFEAIFTLTKTKILNENNE